MMPAYRIGCPQLSDEAIRVIWRLLIESLPRCDDNPFPILSPAEIASIRDHEHARIRSRTDLIDTYDEWLLRERRG